MVDPFVIIDVIYRDFNENHPDFFRNVYSMSVTTGMVAAFADDGTIRGYQEPSEIPFGPYAGEYAFLITVYGDGGDSVDDWEYSSNGFSSTTITTDSSISWSANANYGSVTDPIIFE